MNITTIMKNNIGMFEVNQFNPCKQFVFTNVIVTKYFKQF